MFFKVCNIAYILGTSKVIYIPAGVVANPNGPYTYKGQLAPTNSPNAWVIDGTVLTISGANYFVFSSFSPSNLQSLYIAPMTNAFTLGAMTLLSQPTLSWETVGMPGKYVLSINHIR